MYKDWAHKDVRNENLKNANLLFSDLRFAEMPDNIAGSNLCGCSLQGMRISLQCSSFQDVQIDQRNMKLLLYLLTLLNIPYKPTTKVKQNIRAVLKEKNTTYKELIRSLIPEEEYKLLVQLNDEAIL